MELARRTSLVLLILLWACGSASEKAVEDVAEQPDTAVVDVKDIAEGPEVETEVEEEVTPEVIPECTGTDQCDDEDDCTIDECVDGHCVSTPNLELCPECYAEGEEFESEESQGMCCGDLVPVSACLEDPLDCDGYCWPPYECVCPNCFCWVCTMCGDGECGTGENGCNCPDDCEEEAPNFCLQEGGTCMNPVQETGDGCISGAGPVDIPGCVDGALCCMSNPDCVDEGAAFVDGGAKNCCPGLTVIPGATWDPALLTCASALGEKICSMCGNEKCEEGWESPCNCPEDCTDQVVPMPCIAGFEQCPPGMYCRFPTGSCATEGVWGECSPIPVEPCIELADSVCGCDGITYDIEWYLREALQSMFYHGPCSENCFGPGYYFEGFYAENPCCPGLEPILDCQQSGGQCDCPTCPCFICAPCGDGSCQPGENSCNCADDCGGLGLNVCDLAGGVCGTIGDDGNIDCPEGTLPSWLAGCANDAACCQSGALFCAADADCDDFNPCTCDKCIDGVCFYPPAEEVFPGCGGPPGCCLSDEDCAPSDGPCVEVHCDAGSCAYTDIDPCEICAQEGQTLAVEDGIMPCCPGLLDIPPATWNQDNGACATLTGAIVCAACGNGYCEQAWENICNCPEDCQ